MQARGILKEGSDPPRGLAPLATWKKLEGTTYAKYIPVTIAMPPDEAKRAGYNPTNSRCWVVEGRLQNRVPSVMKSTILPGSYESSRTCRAASPT